jgi:hypothetical protein
MVQDEIDIAKAAVPCIEATLERLRTALLSGASVQSCLRRWSEFVRTRDGHQCVDCHSRKRLSAHHICRKSLVPSAQFETGNGITLCSRCHREIHAGFNGRPDLSQPVDARGAEKLPHMERLYSILTDDAVARGLTREDFYFLSNKTLVCFKRMQGYSDDTCFPGARIEQAYLILAECEFATRQSTLEADGTPMPDKPLLPGGMYLVYPASEGESQRSLVVQTYMPRWKT